MPHDGLLTPAALEASHPSWAELGVKRLQLTAGMAAAVALVGAVLIAFRQPNLGVRASTERPLWVIYAGLALSLATLALARWRRLPAERRLDLGLVFMVALCALSGLFRHSLPYAPSDVVRGVSPVAVIVLFFAAAIPVEPWRMAVAATLAALLDPLALWATVASGAPLPPWNLWLWLTIPNVVAVVLAVVTARFLYAIGETVARARELGAYQLVEKLGEGGMGEVWRAKHQTLARPAAIKLVRADRLGAKDADAARAALARFEREAQATAELQSPHTIEVYDVGTAEDGTFYYVMELLDGWDLQALVAEEGALTPARAVHLLLQVCHSLRDAHAAGMIHRDIKPANIYVCRKGVEADFVKVLDFGLVKRLDEHDLGETQLTRDGALVGSPGYIAPEVLLGEPATPAADVYAFGCVAYFALAARRVFERPSLTAQILAATQDEPEPLGRVSPHALPPGLEPLVMRCLAKDPAERPEGFEELERALRRLDVAGSWSPAQARAWWSRVGPDAETIPPER